MKVLIAPGSFKDCLSAVDVANYVKEALVEVLPDADLKLLPITDGGQGTMQLLIEALYGRKIKFKVHDPLMRIFETEYGILGDNETAVMDMAAASGIERLKQEERNPMITSTYGTGELIKAALDAGCSKIILGIGGSATNDAGVGALEALGVKFFDQHNILLSNIGADLSKIVRIDITDIDKRIAITEILIACDVSNPLTGTEGASFVYGLQKGASPEMVRLLDQHLGHFARLIIKQFKIDIEKLEGSGAAGGLGGGLVALAGAKLISGFELVRQLTDMDKSIMWADLIITGEGCIDSSTLFGKAPAGIAKICLQHKKPVIAIAGSLGANYQELYNYGFDAIYCISDGSMTLQESIDDAPELIKKTMKLIGKTLNLRKT